MKEPSFISFCTLIPSMILFEHNRHWVLNVYCSMWQIPYELQTCYRHLEEGDISSPRVSSQIPSLSTHSLLSLTHTCGFTYNFYSDSCQICISQCWVPAIWAYFTCFSRISNRTSANLNTLSPSKNPAPCPVFLILRCSSTIAWDCSRGTPKHLGSFSPVSLNFDLPSPLYNFPHLGPCILADLWEFSQVLPQYFLHCCQRDLLKVNLILKFNSFNNPPFITLAG